MQLSPLDRATPGGAYPGPKMFSAMYLYILPSWGKFARSSALACRKH